MDSGSLDDIIARLLDVRSGRPGKQVQLSEAEIRQLCVTSKDIFLTQPNLLELEAPIKICGNNNNTSSLLFLFFSLFRLLSCFFPSCLFLFAFLVYLLLVAVEKKRTNGRSRRS
jgi:hypothetical protein